MRKELLSEELDRTELRELYRVLDIDIPRDANDWITIKSPLRDEKNPSFRLNVNSTSWMDHGTGQKGDIVTLVGELTGKDKQESTKWIREIVGNGINNHSQRRKAPAKKSKQNQRFWTADRLKLYKQSHQRLIENQEHELVSMVQERDEIPFNQLVKYGCGLIAIYKIKRWLSDSLRARIRRHLSQRK